MSDELERRSRRFNETTGVYGYLSVNGRRGGNHHPDRCVCQGDPNPQPVDLRVGAVGPKGDTTPHKHYPEPPFACARCPCSAYRPALPEHKPRVGLIQPERWRKIPPTR